MKIAAIIGFLIVGISLFIAHKKQWLNKATFDALLVSATVLAALAAIFVFVIPAAQPAPDNNNEPAKPRTQNANSSGSANSRAEVTNSNREKTENSNRRLVEDAGRNTNIAKSGEAIKGREEFITVSEGATQRVFENEIIVSVQKVSVDTKVTATIGSPGFRNAEIVEKGVGFTVPYRTKRKFEVRIVAADWLRHEARFLVLLIGKN